MTKSIEIHKKISRKTLNFECNSYKVSAHPYWASRDHQAWFRKKSVKVPSLIQSLIMSNTRLLRKNSRVDLWGFYWQRKIKTWGSLPREIPSLGSLCQEKVQVLGHSVQSTTKTWWPLGRQDKRLGISLGRKDPRLDFSGQRVRMVHFLGSWALLT